MRRNRHSRQELAALLKAAGHGGGSVWVFRKPVQNEGPFVPWKKKASGGEGREPRAGA